MIIRKSIASILIGLSVVCLIPTDSHAANNKAYVLSENDGADLTKKINNDDRENAYVLLTRYMNTLKTKYDLSSSTVAKLDSIMYQANVYIANNEMTLAALHSYIDDTKTRMDAAVGNATIISDTSSFLFLCNETPKNTVKYGESVSLTLSLINLGREDVSDIVIKPNMSNDPSKWPFVITNASYVRTLPAIPKSATADEAYGKKQNMTWEFTVSDKALTGTYPLSFHVQYYRNGNIEEADLTTYVEIKGKAGNGNLITPSENESAKTTPRIIVTGFKTEPETVYAGDTFKLSISVNNTSSMTAVSNIQFDLKADIETSDGKNSYAAFLPTSGSATIYVPRIGAGETTTLQIEMSSRGDLTQKPYVVTIDAKYEDDKHNPFEATTNVSVPIKQEARVETGDAEVFPASINVGEQSNVTFDIYNMGKTTLYNIKLSFDNDQAVTGGNAFIGKLDPGASNNFDVTITGNEPTQMDTVIATISYEDESGAVTEFQKELSLSVYEAVESDYQDDSTVEEYEEEQSTSSKSMPWWGITLIVLAAVGVATIIFVNIKKKKNLISNIKLYDDDDED